MKSLATWCVRHRVAVVILWLVALIGMTALSQTVGTAYSNSFSLPHTGACQPL
jgi:RND superfamily putative drug exporter